MYSNREFTHVKKTSKKLEQLKEILKEECVSENRDFERLCKIPLFKKKEE